MAFEILAKPDQPFARADQRAQSVRVLTADMDFGEPPCASQLRQPPLQPDRQLPAFVHDLIRSNPPLRKVLGDGFRVRRDNRAVRDDPVVVHHADRYLFQRYIQPDIQADGSSPRGFIGEASLAGPRTPEESDRRDHAMSF